MKVRIYSGNLFNELKNEPALLTIERDQEDSGYRKNQVDS